MELLETEPKELRSDMLSKKGNLNDHSIAKYTKLIWYENEINKILI